MSWHRYIPAHRRKGMAPTLHLLLSHPPTIHVSYVGGWQWVFYAAPESAGPSQFSPYSSLLSGFCLRLYCSRSQHEKCTAFPGRILETSRPWNRARYYSDHFSKGHIYKMRRWITLCRKPWFQCILSSLWNFWVQSPNLAYVYLFPPSTAVIHLIMIEFQTDDPDVVKCVKARGPIFRRNDCTTLQITCMQTVFMAYPTSTRWRLCRSPSWMHICIFSTATWVPPVHFRLMAKDLHPIKGQIVGPFQNVNLSVVVRVFVQAVPQRSTRSSDSSALLGSCVDLTMLLRRLALFRIVCTWLLWWEACNEAGVRKLTRMNVRIHEQRHHRILLIV